MGRVKHHHMEEEAAKEIAWAKKCEYRGWQCSQCEDIPSLAEREIYFQTGMCGYCAHMTSKDDELQPSF